MGSAAPARPLPEAVCKSHARSGLRARKKARPSPAPCSLNSLSSSPPTPSSPANSPLLRSNPAALADANRGIGNRACAPRFSDDATSTVIRPALSDFAKGVLAPLLQARPKVSLPLFSRRFLRRRLCGNRSFSFSVFSGCSSAHSVLNLLQSHLPFHAHAIGQKSPCHSSPPEL